MHSENNSGNQPEKKKTKIVWTGFIVRLLILFLLLIVGYFAFVGYKVSQFQRRVVVTSENNEQKESLLSVAKSVMGIEKKMLKGSESDRINVLLLGMGGEGHKGKNLTDTIMVASINPKTYESAMLSLPRDLYVEIPEKHVFTKINAVYTFELDKEEDNQAEAFESVQKAVEKVLDQEIHYYVTLDFDGFKQIIDELGGIDVEVEHDIYDSTYPGPNYSYETFQIDKGFHHLDAETALKYARVRHTKGGDFGRAARQQQVLAAAKKKAFSLGTIANPQKISNLLDILGDHLKTNIKASEIPVFVDLAKKINIHQTTNKVLDAWSADSLLASTHVELGGVQAYVLQPRTKNYSQVHELAENIFQLDEIKRKNEAIEKENASVLIIPKNPRDHHRIAGTFRKLGYETTLRSDINASPCLGGDEIYSYSEPAKLFTLNDLADKLGSKVLYLKNDFDFDIAVCISDETADYFEKQRQQKEDERNNIDNVLDEDGNVLFNTN